MSLKQKLIAFLLAIYFFPFIGFAIYYQIKFSTEHALGNTIFYRIQATCKALIWPYYAFVDTEKEIERKSENDDGTIQNQNHFQKSITYHVKASKLINIEDLQRNNFDLNLFKEYIDTLKIAENEGSLVNIVLLERDDPEFAMLFKNKYLHGLRLQIHGYETKDSIEFYQGAETLAEWLEGTN